ncbi:hypothetical protein HK102_013850, partial [Quaeritorhiza haematococci]
GNATFEVFRLKNENIGLLIADLTSTLTISEQQVISIFNILQCASLSTANELSNKAVYKTFMRTAPPSSAFGVAMADLLVSYNLLRVAIISENSIACTGAINGFTEHAASRNISIVVTRELLDTASYDLYINNYRKNVDWASYIKSVKDSGAQVIVHCGFYSKLSLMDAAIKAGYMDDENSKMLFFFIELLNATHLIPHLHGTFHIMPKQSLPERSAPYNQLMNTVLSGIDTNSSFKVDSVLPMQENDLASPSCLMAIVPTLAELVKRNKTSWRSISKGNLLKDVSLKYFLQVANELQVPGLRNTSFQFDTSTGDPYAPFQIYNAFNKTRLLELMKPDSSLVPVSLLQPIGIWLGGSIKLDRAAVFPDGSTTPPRVVPLAIPYQRSQPLFLGVLITGILLEVSFAGILAMIVIKRNTAPVRKNSFRFLCLIVVGCMVLLASSFPGFVSAYDTHGTCMALGYLAHLGFAVTFGSICLKVYRIWRIFTNQAATNVNLPDEYLLKCLVAIFALFLLLLLGQTFATPWVFNTYSSTIDELTTKTWSICKPDILEYVLLALEFIMLAGGTYLAVMTRGINEDYNEAQSLGLSIYNAFFLLVVAVAVEAVLTPLPETKHLIGFLRVSLTTSAIVGVMCITKLIKHDHRRTPPSTTKENRFGPLSGVTSSSKVSSGTAKIGLKSGNYLDTSSKDKTDRSELMQRIQELESQVAPLQEQVAELTSRNAMLERENEQLKMHHG